LPETIMPVAASGTGPGRATEANVYPGEKCLSGEQDALFTPAPFEGLVFPLNSSQDLIKLTVCRDAFREERIACRNLKCMRKWTCLLLKQSRQIQLEKSYKI
jgi:hypothetical protein